MCASRRGSRVAPAPLDSARRCRQPCRRGSTGKLRWLLSAELSLVPPPPPQVTSDPIYHLSHPVFFTILAYLPSFTFSFPHHISPPNFLTISTSKFLHRLSVASFSILPLFSFSSQLHGRHHLSHPSLLIALHSNGCQLAARMSICPIFATLQRHKTQK